MKEWRIFSHLLTVITLAACSLKPAQQTYNDETSTKTVTVFACYDGFFGFPNNRCNDYDDKFLDVKFTVRDLLGNEIARSQTSDNGHSSVIIKSKGEIFLGYPRVKIEKNNHGKPDFACTLPQALQADPKNPNTITVDLPYHPSYCHPEKPEEENAVLPPQLAYSSSYC